MDIIRAIRLVSSINAGEEYLAEAVTYLKDFEDRMNRVESRLEGLCEVNSLWDGS